LFRAGAHHRFHVAVRRKAHAQGFFHATPAGPQNIAWNLIDYLFSPTPATQQAVAPPSAPPIKNATGTAMPLLTIQNTLWTALAFYSNAMLIFAGIILFYHLASMIVDTAIPRRHGPPRQPGVGAHPPCGRHRAPCSHRQRA